MITLNLNVMRDGNKIGIYDIGYPEGSAGFGDSIKEAFADYVRDRFSGDCTCCFNADKKEHCCLLSHEQELECRKSNLYFKPSDSPVMEKKRV